MISRSTPLQPNEEALCRQAVLTEPDNPRACQALGLLLLLRGGQTEEGLRWLGRAVELSPGSAEFRTNLAAGLGGRGRHREAERHLREAVRLAPTSAQAHNNLGVALEHLGRYEEAVAALHESVRLKPADGLEWTNLSNALRKTWRAEEARVAAIESLRLNTESAEAHNALGAALLELGRVEEASESFDQALARDPGHAEARVNRAMSLLTRGRLLEGFAAFESRLDHPVWRRRLAGKRWEASEKTATAGPGLSEAAAPAAGSTVLLYAEGGLGNAIQFVRYAPLLARRGVRVIVECRRELVKLLSTVAEVEQVVGFGQALPHYDCYAALMSLPALMGTALDTVPATVPYLSAQPDRIQRWSSIMRQFSGFRVGMCWQGEQTPAHRRNRSLPLASFAPLAQVPDVKLISLQKGCAVDAKFPMVELPGLDESGSGAFLDTAAVMKHLDLVITCDTSIAHLAGALGVPVWVALRFAADWRWMRECEDTRWYPTMQLFRQDRSGDWAGVPAGMARVLETKLRS